MSFIVTESTNVSAGTSVIHSGDFLTEAFIVANVRAQDLMNRLIANDPHCDPLITSQSNIAEVDVRDDRYEATVTLECQPFPDVVWTIRRA